LIIAGVEPNPGPAAITMGLLNARSTVNKGPLIQDIITSNHLDVLAVTETWIVGDDPDAVKLDAVPAGYDVCHLPRPTATSRSRGGGVCIIHRNNVVVKRHPLHQRFHWQSFECQLVSVKMMRGAVAAASETFSLAVIYRPPSSTTASLTAFYDELSELFTRLGPDIDADRFIACGDVNCPGDGQDVNPAELLSVLDTHGLRQLVTTATRRTPTGSSLLDVVIASCTTRRLHQVTVSPSYDVSDHDLITWLLSVKSRPPRQVLTYRFHNLKQLDMQQFNDDIRQSEVFQKPASTADEFADQLDTVVVNILDKHCPLQVRQEMAPSRPVNRCGCLRALKKLRDFDDVWSEGGNQRAIRLITLNTAEHVVLQTTKSLLL